MIHKIEMDTKDKILEAAVKLFTKNGFHETSMAAIAEEAGFGKGTLYWHFSSKDELFGEAVIRGGKEIIKETHNFIIQEDESQSAGDVLKSFFRLNFKRIYRSKKIIGLFTNTESYFSSDVKKVFLKIHSAITSEVEEIIKLGIENGEFRNISSRKAAIFIVGSLGAMNGIILEDNIEDIEELVESLYDLVLKGIQQKGDE